MTTRAFNAKPPCKRFATRMLRIGSRLRLQGFEHGMRRIYAGDLKEILGYTQTEIQGIQVPCDKT